MLFPTITFAIFFAIVLPLGWLLQPHRKAWKWFALAANYVFYGWWDWRFLALIGASTLVNQLLVWQMTQATTPRGRKGFVAAAVAANLVLLGFFKYYGFFVLSAENGLRALGVEAELPLLDIVLPVGISFFTFQALSYVVQVYRGQVGLAKTLDFAVYLSFFPQLLAGPIVRASEFLPQLDKARDSRFIEAPRAARLIFGGLVKKMLLADILAREIVNPVFTNPGDFTSPEILLGVYGYAVQIYCDFSAYSDIAIGVAALLGFKLPDNFNAPYTATSLQDFWRRWHMTLSRWLRDFLYIPLGGSKGSKFATYRNLLITMVLGGLWHGASWNFVLWGGMHGAWLAAERFLRERFGDRGEPGPLGKAARRILIFHFVCFAWIFFRCPKLEDVGEILGGLTRDWSALPAVSPVVILILVVGIGVQFIPPLSMVRLENAFGRLAPALQAVILALVLLVIDAIGPAGVAAFIYFQF